MGKKKLNDVMAEIDKGIDDLFANNPPNDRTAIAQEIYDKLLFKWKYIDNEKAVSLYGGYPRKR